MTMWVQPASDEPGFWSAGRREVKFPKGGHVAVDLAADETGPRATVEVVDEHGTAQLGEFNSWQIEALADLFATARSDIQVLRLGQAFGTVA